MTFRYELRLHDGSYAGTFVTAVPVELIEVSNERPAFALWEVEPALAAAAGGEARAQ